MEKIYIVKGDHAQDHSDSYACFYDKASNLTILGSCLATSFGSGFCDGADLAEWNNSDDEQLEMEHGYGAYLSFSLKKEKEHVIIVNDEDECQIPRDKFTKIVDAWQKILKQDDEPVVIELLQDKEGFTLTSSIGSSISIT
jgi:hypothetical protein